MPPLILSVSFETSDKLRKGNEISICIYAALIYIYLVYIWHLCESICLTLYISIRFFRKEKYHTEHVKVSNFHTAIQCLRQPDTGSRSMTPFVSRGCRVLLRPAGVLQAHHLENRSWLIPCYIFKKKKVWDSFIMLDFSNKLKLNLIKL